MKKTLIILAILLTPHLAGATINTNLSLGSENQQVTELQQILVSKGHLTMPAGTSYGYYGTLTQSAVQEFQCANNIICTGTADSTGYGAVGPKTREVLNSSNQISKSKTSNGEVLGASTVVAASCSRDDVVTALGLAKDGDTINVPSGSCMWDKAIGIGKRITIQGAGIGNTIITLATNGFSLSVEARVSGFTFLSNGKSGTNYHVKGLVDTWFEVDNNRFESLNSTKQLGVHAASPSGKSDPKGLIHNNEFYNTRILVQGDLANGAGGFGRDIWALSDRVPGTANTVFIEDNEFILTVFGNVVDDAYGGHYVFRHNTVTDGSIEAHGITSSAERGNKFVEISDNVVIKTKSNYIRPFFIRGGTARIYNNVLKGPWGIEIEIDSEHNRNSNVSGVADANGPGEDGYPWRDQIGAGTDEFEYKGIGPWPKQEIWPMYQWNNKDDNGPIGFTLTNTDGGQQRTAIEGRDYINNVSAFDNAIKIDHNGNTVKIGYNPYPYPHPLRSDYTPPTPSTDTDKDGVPNTQDKCPNTPLGSVVDSSGCIIVDNTPIDTDKDGVIDSLDKCPNTPLGSSVDSKGCIVDNAPIDTDTDKDGVIDSLDKCPNTPQRSRVDSNGCIKGNTSIDTDKDGVPDYLDKCPNTKAGQRVNSYGCPKPKDRKNLIKNNLDTKDLKNVAELVLEDRNKGSISFYDTVSLVKEDGEQIEIDDNVEFTSNSVTLNSSKLPELNKQANITLFNVNLKNPVIKKDGQICSECRILSNTNGNLSFLVSGFSTYTVEEGTPNTETPEATPDEVPTTTTSSSGGGSRRSTSSTSSSGIFLTQQDKVELLNILKILRSAGAITEQKYQNALSIFSISDTSFPSNTACYQITRNLTIGSSGNDVTKLQQYLVSKGHLSIPANTPYGYYGQLTKSAVTKYQLQNMNVKSSSAGVGNVGPLTRGSLGCI